MPTLRLELHQIIVIIKKFWHFKAVDVVIGIEMGIMRFMLFYVVCARSQLPGELSLYKFGFALNVVKMGLSCG